jgi:hypothetical protein
LGRVIVRPARLAVALASIAALSLTLTLPTLAAAAPANPVTELVDAYSPITMLREEQDPPCEKTAEQYEPTTVNTVLGNPSVELRRVKPDGKQETQQTAPTATDIAGLGDEYHLDLHGDPLGDTCVYAKDFRTLVEEGRAPPVTYAHIAREGGHSGFVVQYWFFYYFNQFNDLHEGDWEGMQIAFEANDAKRALWEGPYEIILFQHAGGERANWEDSKVQKEGTHPIVYPAAGSHATFYDSAVYVENGSHGSGVGCDNTTEPLRRVVPEPVLLPTHPTPSGEFKWLTFYGHWGQLEKGFNNGPTGPITKTVWSEPFTWMADQRSTSPRLPGGSVVGPQVTGAFCGAVATVSELINLDAESHLAAVITIVVAILIVAAFVFLTKWGPVDLTELRAKRSFGQLVRAARQLYGRHWKVLLPIGLTAIPIVGGINLLAQLVSTTRDLDEAKSGLHLALGDLLEFVGRPMAEAIVAGAVIVYVRGLLAGLTTTFVGSYAGMKGRFWRAAFSSFLASLGVLLLAITVIGLPWAAWKLVGWQFVEQEVLFEDKSLREAFRGSSDRVRGRWWHAVRATLFFFLLGVVAGPVVGFALIFLNFSLLWINLVGSLVFALLVPYITLGHTLLYFDCGARMEAEPERPRHGWRFWEWRPHLRRAPSPTPGVAASE